MENRHIKFHKSDEQYVERYSDQVRILAGMAVEMMEENPRMVLSPIMRETLANQAKRVEEMRVKLMHKLCVDNLHDPL